MTDLKKLASKYVDEKSDTDSFYDAFIAGYEASLSSSIYLTENQIAELAQIGSQHLYLDAMEEGRISYGGIMEILKRYEELRKTDR